MRKKAEAPTVPADRGRKPAARQAGARQDAVPKTSTGIGRFAVSGGLLVTLVVAAGLLMLGGLQFGRHQDLADQRVAYLLAREQATLVAEHVALARTLATGLASSDLVTAAMQDGDVATMAASLTQALPGARVELVAPKQLLVPEALSFTARELITGARADAAAQLAVVPGPPAVLYVAKATPANGVVLVEWSLDRLAAVLKKQDIGRASVSLSAPGGASLLAIGDPGQAGQRFSRETEGGLTVEVAVPPGDSDPALTMLFAAVGGGTLVLTLFIFLSTLSAVSRGLRKDSALLSHLAQDLAGNPGAEPRGRFAFPVLGLATGSLRRLARRGAAPRAQDGDGDGLHALVGEEDAGLLVSQDRERAGAQLPREIFREYDIRGTADRNLTGETVRLLGQAIGTEALQAGQQTVIVARDGRLSSPALAEALIEGITASGRNVIDIGMVPTPVLHYATKVLDSSTGVCVTGSHNPASENGLKITIADTPLHGKRLLGLRERIARGELASGAGQRTRQDVSDRYVEEIVNDIVLARPMKVALDCGNGVAGRIAPGLLQQLGCEVIELFTEVDGNFPNHAPDTSDPDNYAALRKAVLEGGAEIGIALDGDGDRIGVVSPDGEIIWPDRLMMLFARDLLSRSPGADVIFDVKCSRELGRLISAGGGRPLMWKTGHSLIRARLQETGAPLAGEMSGHIFFADRWHGFDDGLYAAGRLLEILSLEGGAPGAVFATVKTGVCTPELRIPADGQARFALVEKLQARAAEFVGGTPATIDGLRVDYEDGWGLVRASNTGPSLTARFEGRDEQALERIKAAFREQLKAVNPQLNLPF